MFEKPQSKIREWHKTLSAWFAFIESDTMVLLHNTQHASFGCKTQLGRSIQDEPHMRDRLTIIK